MFISNYIFMFVFVFVFVFEFEFIFWFSRVWILLIRWLAFYGMNRMFVGFVNNIYLLLFLDQLYLNKFDEIGIFVYDVKMDGM